MSLTPAQRETIIRRMERSCFNAAVVSSTRDGIICRWTEPRFCERYSAECYRVLSHLSPSSAIVTAAAATDNAAAAATEPYLLSELITGNIPAGEIADLPTITLCPDATVEERAEISRRQGVKLDVKVSRAHKCKCGKNETTVIEYMSRSADEAMTLSIRCVHCGNTWRKF